MLRKRASSGPPPPSSSEDGNILKSRTEADGDKGVSVEAVASSSLSYQGAFGLIPVSSFRGRVFDKIGISRRRYAVKIRASLECLPSVSESYFERHLAC